MRLDAERLEGLRVAFVCTDPGIPVFGCKGASVHVQEVLRAFLRAGARPELFTCRTGGPAPSDLAEVPVHHLPRPSGTDPAARERDARRLDALLGAALARCGPHDLVYQRYALWSDHAMRYACDAGIPGVLEVNAPLVDEQARHRELVDHEAAEALTRSAFAGAHALVAVSEPVGRWTRARIEAPSRVHVVPNGVDPTRFQVDLVPGRRRAGDPFTVGFVGTLKPWHGLDTLVEAFEALAARSPAGEAVHLLVVGDGPRRGAVEAALAARGLEGLATFTGALAPDVVPSALARMDAAVAPYPAPGDQGFYFSPLKVLEYMAAGVPVVASRLPSLEALLEGGARGLLVPPEAPLALADALDLLRRDPELAGDLAHRAREAVVAHHSWDQVLARSLAPVPLSRGAACTPGASLAAEGG
jgi:glycosyltransferase involved in cell wall biosynthesis